MKYFRLVIPLIVIIILWEIVPVLFIPVEKRIASSLAKDVSQRKNQIKEKLIDFIRLQESVVKYISLFQTKKNRNQDIGLFLNSSIAWIGDVDSSHTIKTEWRQYLLIKEMGRKMPPNLLLPIELEEYIQSLGPDFIAESGKIDLNQIDFSWFEDLKKYGYWSVYQNNIYDHMEQIDFVTVPIPNFSRLILWAKLRLIKGVQDNELSLAMKETLQLARLCMSTENHIGNIVGISILEILNYFRESHGYKSQADMQYFQNTKHYTNMLASLFSDVLMSGDDLERIYSSVPAPFACLAIDQMGQALFQYSIGLKEKLIDLRKKFDRILNSSTCRLPLLRAALYTDDSRFIIHSHGLKNLGFYSKLYLSIRLLSVWKSRHVFFLILMSPNSRWLEYYLLIQALQFRPL
jgi:hypothetical protein